MNFNITLTNIQSQAKKILEHIRSEHSEANCIAFFGKMGSGKTTFIKALCSELQVVDTVTSPTFAIINEYQTRNEKLVYHFDFYRIEKIEEVFDLGYEDYFYSYNYCLIEWAELIEGLLPENYVKITITEIDSETRLFNIR